MAIEYEILSIDREAKVVKVKYINPRLDEDRHRNLERDVAMPVQVDGEDYTTTLNSRIEAVGLGVEVKMSLVLDALTGKKAKAFDQSLNDLGIPDFVPEKTVLPDPSFKGIELEPEPVLDESMSELLVEDEI